MIINMLPPSVRLRDDLRRLEWWARMAPPDADECDWGWDHYAANIRSILNGLDHEFAELQQKCRELEQRAIEAETSR
jgi:hypothetical protein